MGIKEDYQQAVGLAKQGHFKEARALIIAYDHPKTNALLQKIEQAMQTDNSEKKVWKFLKQGCLTIIAILISGSIACAGLYLATNWNWFFGTGKQEFIAPHICTYAELYDLNCDPVKLTDFYMRELTTCYQQLGMIDFSSTGNRGAYLTCLQYEGVDF